MGELSNTTINGVSYDFKDAGAARQSHSHTKSQITDFPTSMPASDVPGWAKASTKPTYTASEVGAIATTEKGAANGVASLDSTGKVPSSQLPSYVDDVLEYSAKSSFPTTGETGKIYVDTSTNKTYRWSGSAYVEISESLALGDTSSTAYYGDKGKAAYDHATESGRLTTATASGLYKVASTAQGHIASLTPVAKSDITGLGIPAQDTTYGVVSTSANGLAPKVTDTSKFLKGDGTWATPANTWTAMVGATSSANGSVGYVNAVPPKDGYNTKYLRADGSWQVPPNTTYSAATTSAAGLMSAADKTKLNGIATGANNYSHPTSAGNKHIPSGGSSGQILVYGGSSGTASWGNDISTASIPANTFATFNGAAGGVDQPYDWCVNKHGKHITGFAKCWQQGGAGPEDLVFTINSGYRPSTLVGVLFILTSPYEATDLNCNVAVGSINTSGVVKCPDFADHVYKGFVMLFDYFTA